MKLKQIAPLCQEFFGTMPAPATPPGGKRDSTDPSLEYLYSTSPQPLSDNDFEAYFSYLESDDYLEDLISNEWPRRCPNVKGKVLSVRGYPCNGDILYRAIVSNIRCKRWNCKPCAQAKARMILVRAGNGELAKEVLRLIALGYKYPLKMFTLTLPGYEYRSSHTPMEGVELLRRKQNNLLRELQRRYGRVLYFCVVEPHKSGWPHLHIVLTGEGIAKEKLYSCINNIWHKRFGMGYVWVSKGKKWNKEKQKHESIQVSQAAFEAISYAVKYMWKGVQAYGYKKKLWSASAGALAPISSLVQDYGFPVFVQVNREDKEDVVLDKAHRTIDSYTLFETKSVAELEAFRYSLGDGVFPCSVKAEVLLDLKEEFPNAMLPRVWRKKV